MTLTYCCDFFLACVLYRHLSIRMLLLVLVFSLLFSSVNFPLFTLFLFYFNAIDLLMLLIYRCIPLCFFSDVSFLINTDFFFLFVLFSATILFPFILLSVVLFSPFLLNATLLFFLLNATLLFFILIFLLLFVSVAFSFCWLLNSLFVFSSPYLSIIRFF